jgi:YidC/Oxa1 family membrane protein insertase
MECFLMEKRALIALVLSLFVLLFWEYFFGLMRTKDTRHQPESGTVAPGPAETKPKAAPSELPPPVSPSAIPQEKLLRLDQHYDQWTMDSPRYRSQVLAPGARMNSFLLKGFRQEVAPDSPPVEMVSSQGSGYLPLAVDLLHHKAWQISTTPFTSQAPPELSLKPGDSVKTLSFFAEIPGQVKLTKLFSYSPESYAVDFEIQVKNLAQEPLADQLGVSFFFQPLSDAKDESSYNKSQLSALEKGSLTTFELSDLSKKETILKPPLDWVGYGDNFFLQALVPIEERGYEVVPRVLDAAKGLLQVVYLPEPFQLDANQEKTFKLRLYLGPKELDYLKEAEHNLVDAVDYGWFSFLAKPALYVLKWVYKYVHNYGVAIILLTIFIKILFWPLTQKSFKSMQAMKKIQPKIAQVREKYKDDREKLNQELMGLYKTYKVNPMGGCLPMVLQIPVFIALYRMLNTAVELRHEPFMLWINDLTAPDRLHIGIDIPYLGGIPVLTLLMGISMFAQQKMTPSSGDPRQEQIMLLMPVIFTVFFINFPAGLVLYWLVNNILSIVQQYWINRSTK